MPLLIIVLFSSAAVFACVAVAGLVFNSERRLVSRRLRETYRRSSATGSLQGSAVRSTLESGLGSVGARLIASRTNLEGIRESLSRGGYRQPNVLAVYFAGRAILMFGLASITLITAPLLGLSAGAGLLAVPYPILIGWLVPRFWLKHRIGVRQKALQRALPDTLDLLVVCVEAGLGLNQALARVAQEIEPVGREMGAELRTLNLEIRAGTSREDAFRNLGRRTGLDDLRELASMLIQADRFGTSVAQALRIQAETLRTKRRQRAEEAAAKTTIKLVFPLVLFIFPALFVIILGPALVSALRM